MWVRGFGRKLPTKVLAAVYQDTAAQFCFSSLSFVLYKNTEAVKVYFLPPLVLAFVVTFLNFVSPFSCGLLLFNILLFFLCKRNLLNINFFPFLILLSVHAQRIFTSSFFLLLFVCSFFQSQTTGHNVNHLISSLHISFQSSIILSSVLLLLNRLPRFLAD